MRINICWKHFDSTKDILQGLLTQDGEQFANQLAVIKEKIETVIRKGKRTFTDRDT